MIDPDSLLIGIAAHVSRRDMAYELAERTRAHIVNVDETRAETTNEAVTACAQNHLAVLKALRAEATTKTWCIVLEDDALPVADFRTHAAAALEYAPHPMVGFYIGLMTNTHDNVTAREYARRNGFSWLVATHLISAVAYAIRGDVLQQAIDRYPGFPPETTVERRLTDWASERRGGTFYGYPRFCFTVPSLVDHWDGDSIVSPGADGATRKAWWVGVADNWDTPEVEYDCQYQ